MKATKHQVTVLYSHYNESEESEVAAVYQYTQFLVNTEIFV